MATSATSEAAAGWRARPRLTYFCGWGLGEPARWLLAATHARLDEWENVELERFEQFDALRKSGALLFGQLPLLEVDGLRLVQSQAIVRYLARRHGLGGKDAAEAALVDMVCETVRDLRGFVTRWPFAVEDQEAIREQAIEKASKVLSPLEEIIARAGGESLLASGPSAADVILAETIHELRGEIVPEERLAEYSGCLKVHDKVLALPGVAAYVASPRRRPFPAGQVGAEYVRNVRTVLGTGN